MDSDELTEILEDAGNLPDFDAIQKCVKSLIEMEAQ